MKQILIATPSYDGKLDVWYTNSLWRTIILGLQNEIQFVPVFMSYDALIQRSRNDLIGIAKDSKFDGILWIDADVEWDPQWAVNVVQANKDVLGLPIVKKIIDEQYSVKCNFEDLNPDEEGFIEVESNATGFLYMSKAAIDYLWDNSEAYTHNGQDRRWIFETGIQDGDIIGEDVWVCRKLRQGGFKIYIDSTKTCNHIGSLKYTGNFAEYVERVKAWSAQSLES